MNVEHTDRQLDDAEIVIAASPDADVRRHASGLVDEIRYLRALLAEGECPDCARRDARRKAGDEGGTHG